MTVDAGVARSLHEQEFGFVIERVAVLEDQFLECLLIAEQGRKVLVLVYLCAAVSRSNRQVVMAGNQRHPQYGQLDVQR